MKYDRLENNSLKEAKKFKIEDILSEGEMIFWKGKPKKKAFILESVFSPLLIFVLVWIAFDGFFLTTLFSFGEELPKFFYAFIALFFIFHLMPVWIWLSHIFTAKKKYENTEYCVTDKRIVIKTGLLSTNYASIFYKDVVSVTLHVGFIDKNCGTGDVYIQTAGLSSQMLTNCIIDVENPQEILKLIQRASVDIQSDMSYPNALRTDNNPGYITRYTQNK